MSIRAVIIPADRDEAITITRIEPTLAAAQEIVGGYLEGLPSELDDGWAAYGNEEGKIEGLPHNERGHHALVKLGGHNPADPLVGNVLIVGFGTDGEWTDVPEEFIEELQDVELFRPGA